MLRTILSSAGAEWGYESQVADDEDTSPEDRQQTLLWLESEREEVYRNPDAKLREWSKKLRQKRFKAVSQEKLAQLHAAADSAQCLEFT